METQLARPGSAGAPAASPPAPRPSGEGAASGATPRRRGEPRPVPSRNEVFGHLSITGLRTYRTALTAEENNVSYWRRILQARLDVVTASGGNRGLDTERLRPVLTSDRVGSGRQALVQVLQVDDIPPLPSLAELWERQVDDADEVARAGFAAELRTAEAQLSEYRHALHRRIAEATSELIARYREQPGLCLTALPREPGRRVSA